VYLGLGSNIDAEKNLRLAVGELRRLYGELTLSPVYKSAPVGFQGPDFLNLVVALETDAAPMEVIDQIERIHGLAGRSRGPDKFSSRPLDIDLLLHGDMIEPAPPLRLPRRDILDYGFVDLLHPVTGRTIAEHWRAFDVDSQPLTLVDVIL
jgi:2-amino-4-hydroxy-6-hydroxymethyldihydropteridine diphosphokinase